MMELKTFQKKVMEDLSSYLEKIDETDDIFKAWKAFWNDKEINVGFGGVPVYQNTIPGVPHICMKVPTGGGKTFMGAASVKRICDHLPNEKHKVVMWLVPSDAILTQTISNLTNPQHPYRQELNKDFGGRVEVYTKEMLLNGQDFSPDTVRERLTVCIFSYASLRINSNLKDVRKVYQENGNLLRFAEYFDDQSVMLADTPDTALIQVLRHLSPIVIVDESHNAKSDLSVEMLKNLNPSFILELTATPRKSSNILSYVDARQLKKENMVKLPVVVFKRANTDSVILDAIQLRNSIEKQAIDEENNGGEYIRPIVLFQAQPKTDDDSEHFEKIKKMLLDIGIPEEQIAIKTYKEDTLKGVDLLSKDCAIRYIITVNALKEGWDCPFAYILASVANKSSKVDVEQILGRILRQPYTKQHKQTLLNTSFVLTCSSDFTVTLDGIVEALNKAGFSGKDYRIAEELPKSENTGAYEQVAFDTTTTTGSTGTESVEENNINTSETEETSGLDTVDTDAIRAALEKEANSPTDADTQTNSTTTGGTNSSVSEMLKAAEAQTNNYMDNLNASEEDDDTSGDLDDMSDRYKIQEQFREEIKELKVPQFYTKQDMADLFGDEFSILEPENLSDGFSLTSLDAQVDFKLATEGMFKVDIQAKGEAVPKYRKVNLLESEVYQKYLESLPSEKKVEHCIGEISNLINKNNRYETSEIKDYVSRAIDKMSSDELELMETSIVPYAKKIEDKLGELERKYRVTQFKKWLDSGRIICRESYMFPEIITIADADSNREGSLYEAEKDDLNNHEILVIDTIMQNDNVEWWHRIIERHGFRLNGYINHYPDFILKTKSGKIILVEAKGDHLAGDDSKLKLELGRLWQQAAGNNYRYFMVFEKKDTGWDGAYTLDKFDEMIKDI